MTFSQRVFQWSAVSILICGVVACGADNPASVDAPPVDMTATAASALIAAALDTPIPPMTPATMPTVDVVATGTALAAQIVATMEGQFAATLTAVATAGAATAAAATATHSVMTIQTAEATSTTITTPLASSTPVQPVASPTNPEPLSPTATICALPADLARIASHEQVRLGCPTSRAVMTTLTVEEFMRGRLIWVEAQDRIYALTTDRVMPVGGRWTSHNNGWAPQMPSLPCPDAEQFGYPAMGFGLLWCNDAEVRQQLGAPIGPERPIENPQLQQFEGGLLLNYSNGQIDILFGDGEWASK